MLSYDPVVTLARFAKRRRIGFSLLSDRKSDVIRAFGLLNRQYPTGSLMHGVAHPMVFVIRADGVISHRFSEGDYRSRPDIDTILEAIRRSG